jgi:hypothetical protein
MAAVTLKDLMDPLSKIAAAAEATNEKLDAFVAMATGSGGARSLEDSIYYELQVQSEHLKQIEINTGKSSFALAGKGGKKGGKLSGVKSPGDVLRTLGASASEMVTGLIAFKAVKKKNVEKFLYTVRETFKVLEDVKKPKKVVKAAEVLEIMGSSTLDFAKSLAKSVIPLMIVDKLGGLNVLARVVTKVSDIFTELGEKKDAKKGAKTLQIMGDSLQSFAKGLVFAAVASAVGILFTPIIGAAIGIMGFIFTMVGKRDKQIKKGAKAVDRMGDAMKSFAIGLAFFALTAALIIMAPVVLVGMVASLVLIGGAFALLGSKKFAKQIRKGAAAVALIGLGLIVFSVGLGIFRLATAGMGLMDVLIQSAVILGIGVATALVGKFGISNILQGAAMLALNGIGLAIFSLGYVPFAAATKGMGLNDILVQSGILLGIGLVSTAIGALVGLTAGAAFLGPALFAAAGGALLLLAPGLKAMKELNYSEQDAKDLATVLGGVAMAFSGVDPEAGAFGMLKGLFTRVMQSGAGLAAAGMYAAAGYALQELSKGLTDFKAVGFDEDDSKELAVALGAVSGAFAQAGGEPASPGGLFGAVFGNMFSPNAVERGIDSVMGAGDALNEVTKGLAAFLDLKKAYGLDNKAFEEGGYLNVAITDTLGFLSKAFATIGGMEVQDGWGPFSWDENLVEKGIDAVKGSGNALKDVTTGLKSFLDLQNEYGLTTESFKEGGYLNVAITDTLGFLSKAFATIGGMEVQDGWGPFSWDENLVEKGVDAVKGAGTELTNIANGLKTFQELIDAGVDWDALADAVTNTLTFVGDAFAVIGGKEEEDGWFIFSWDENLVEKGIDAVAGAGTELTNIATGLKTFQEMIDAGVDWDKLGDAVTKSLTFVGDAFAVIGGKEEEDGWFIFSWDENLVQKGVENVQGAGTELSSIAEGLKAFSDEDIDFKTIGETVSFVLTTVGDAFASIGAGKPSSNPFLSFFGFQENSVQKGIESVSGINEALMEVTDGLKYFMDIFQGEFEDAKSVGDAISYTLTAVGNAFAHIGGQQVTKEVKGMFGFSTSWSQNAVEVGIDAVKNINKSLISTAFQLRMFMDTIGDPYAVADAISALFTSIQESFMFYYDNPDFPEKVDHMKGFLTEISDRAADGSLTVAADEMQRITAAINKIDPYKAEAFAKLFSSAGTLSSNKKAQQELIEAIKEIKDLLKDEGGEGGEGGGLLGGLKNLLVGKGGGGGNDARLNATLGKINSTLSQLPSQIQAIKIEVAPDYN